MLENLCEYNVGYQNIEPGLKGTTLIKTWVQTEIPNNPLDQYSPRSKPLRYRIIENKIERKKKSSYIYK